MKANFIFSSQKGGKHLTAHREPKYTDSKTRQTLQTKPMSPRNAGKKIKQNGRKHTSPQPNDISSKKYQYFQQPHQKPTHQVIECYQSTQKRVQRVCELRTTSLIPNKVPKSIHVSMIAFPLMY